MINCLRCEKKFEEFQVKFKVFNSINNKISIFEKSLKFTCPEDILNNKKLQDISSIATSCICDDNTRVLYNCKILNKELKFSYIAIIDNNYSVILDINKNIFYIKTFNPHKNININVDTFQEAWNIVRVKEDIQNFMILN